MARTLKRNKTKMEKLIRETWYDTNRGKFISSDEQMKITYAIKETIRYFEMEDYLYGSNHVEIIQKIYLSAKYETKTASGERRRIVLITNTGIANKLYISDRTLGRYTNIYIKCFQKYLYDEKMRE